MNNVLKLIFFVSVSAAFAACGGQTENKPANTSNSNTVVTNTNAAPTAPAPAKEAIMALEKSAYEAWKSKNAKFWDPFLTDNFVGLSATGRIDRAAAIKQYSGADCNVKSFAISDDQMTMIGSDAALVTHKLSVDASCGGQRVPPQAWVASIYVRSGDKWKGAFHAEAPVLDPNAPPPNPLASNPAKPDPAEKAPEPAPNPVTDAVLSVEKRMWEAWKTKDARSIEETLSRDFFFLSAQGRADRASTVKIWATDNKCDIKSYELNQPMAVMLSNDAALLTYLGAAEGKCDGNAIPAQWFAGVDLKDGDVWRPAFGMGL